MDLLQLIEGKKSIISCQVDTINIENLTGQKTLTANDAAIQIYTSSASRSIYLPTSGLLLGQKFEFWNLNDFSSGVFFEIYQGTTLLYRLGSRCKVTLRWTGTSWIPEYSDNIAFGYETYGNSNRGVGVGYNAYGNSGGVGVGNNAYGNNVGVGVGNNAYNNYSGVGVGTNAYNNFSGVGVGYNAYSNGNYGVGVGYNSRENSNNGTAIGSNSTTAFRGFGSVAIGAGSNTLRNNEVVFNSSDISANKSLFSICKFREVNLNSNGGVWQEVFLTNSGTRLVLNNNSVLSFRAFVNSIDGTNFAIKSWEFVGVIKRTTSSGTVVVGTITKTVIGEDAGTTNWDARLIADTTNNSLRLEVKHDSSNPVKFSANVLITETRL